jgi:uncharacterized protein (DUF4415 family)
MITWDADERKRNIRKHRGLDAMSNRSDHRLTASERAEIEQRRRHAKARARRLAASLSDAEDAAARAAANADTDNPPLKPGARLRPAHDVHPHLVVEQLRRRGRPRIASPKRQVTLRLDADVIDGMRATGPGWQVRVNDTLRRWLQRHHRV